MLLQLNQVMTNAMSESKRSKKASTLVSQQYKVLSLEILQLLELNTKNSMSFMNSLNQIGPWTESCGTTKKNNEHRFNNRNYLHSLLSLRNVVINKF